MPWDDAVNLESDLNKALAAFDWPEVDALCAKIVARVSTDPEQLPESTARRLMRSLRRKRRFRRITLLAEALIQSGLRTPEVRRQYAQALIDQGTLLAAENVLREIIQDPQGVVREQMEARGLTARIYKQLYVNNNDPASPRNRSNLERALGEYLHVYRLDPRTHLWHGINAVALAARARRDGLPDAGLPDAAALAAEIVATLDKSEEEGGDIRAWDEATRMEAYVALGRQTDAVETARRYRNSESTWTPSSCTESDRANSSRSGSSKTRSLPAASCCRSSEPACSAKRARCSASTRGRWSRRPRRPTTRRRGLRRSSARTRW